MRRLTGTFSLVLFLGACCGAEPTVGDTLRDLTAGAQYPPTIKLGSLDKTWLKVTGPESVDFMSLIMSFAMAAGGQPSGSQSTMYTKGDTVRLGDETFLVVYRYTPLDFANIAKMIDEEEKGAGHAPPPKPPKLTVDSELKRVLLNLHALASIADIRPFDLDAELNAVDPLAKLMAVGREQSTESTSLSNLKQLGVALIQYTQDYDEVLPTVKSDAEVKKALLPYCKSEALFEHPGTHEPYHYNLILSEHKLAHIEAPAQMVAFYEASPAHDGLRGVAFLDGHCKRLTPDEWAVAKRDSKIRD